MYNRIKIKVYPYWITLQAFFLNIIPILTAYNYSPRTRIKIFGLECIFILKALFSAITNQRYKKEKFLGYTVCFPNYLEFVLLFIEIFGIQEYRLRTTKSNLHVVDCGSNWGMSVLYFHYILSNPRITAVEASKTTVSYLKKNLRINHIRNINIIQAFVSSCKGEHPFYINRDNNAWSVSNTGSEDFIKNRKDYTKTLVDSVLLSQVLKKTTTIVKLDIEGMEGEVLSEARHRLTFISEIVIEYHPNMNIKYNNIETILNILIKNNFSVTIVDTKSLIRKKNNLKIIHAVHN